MRKSNGKGEEKIKEKGEELSKSACAINICYNPIIKLLGGKANDKRSRSKN